MWIRLLLLGLLPLFLFAARADAEEAPQCLFVPLDDRPPTLLFVRQIARIGGGRLRLPPRAWLGRFLHAGDPERIADWLAKAGTGCQHAIVSSDMIAYGGLVASRNATTPLDVALRRIEVLERLRRPGMPLHVFGMIPRLALLTSSRQAPYEQRLANWATSPDAVPPQDVPADVVAEYLGVRRRNLSVLLRLLDMTAQGRIDRLVIGQDDSHGTGLHTRDQAVIRQAVAARGLADRVLLLSGADEIAMDMVSGWLARHYGYSPSVRVVYSDPSAATRIPPLESLTLEEAVRGHLALAGGRLAREEEAGDVVLYLKTPVAKPYELPDASSEPAAKAFIETVRTSVVSGRPTALADIALVNMADPFLARALIERVPVHRLQGYAAWNTPSNTLGTVLAQAVAHRLAERFGHTWSANQVLESEKTQLGFILARLVDDFHYQSIVRAQARPSAADLPMDPDPLLNLYGPVGFDIRVELVAVTRQLFDRHFRGQEVYFPGLRRRALLEGVAVQCVLPWKRLFEVELLVDVRLGPLRPAASAAPEGTPR